MKFKLVVPYVILMLGCGDLDSTTYFVVRNDLEAEVSMYYKYSGVNSLFVGDSIVKVASKDEQVWHRNSRLGKESFEDLELFFGSYDSLVAIGADSSVSISYLSNDKWVFKKISGIEGRWILIVDEEDFE